MIPPNEIIITFRGVEYRYSVGLDCCLGILAVTFIAVLIWVICL
jgi:hypothetical protein